MTTLTVPCVRCGVPVDIELSGDRPVERYRALYELAQLAGQLGGIPDCDNGAVCLPCQEASGVPEFSGRTGAEILATATAALRPAVEE